MGVRVTPMSGLRGADAAVLRGRGLAVSSPAPVVHRGPYGRGSGGAAGPALVPAGGIERGVAGALFGAGLAVMKPCGALVDCAPVLRATESLPHATIVLFAPRAAPGAPEGLGLSPT
jgi:hypothetical protein